MWQWLKKLWESKKSILVNTLCGYIDGYKPQATKLLEDEIGKLKPSEIVDKLAEELKAYIRKQV